jgi:DNA-binding NtrC family response regulator
VTCNILLVDDDEIILDTYKTILEMDGYTVFDAINPYKALQIIQNHEIHLAILDYNLPQMTGTQLGHLIKKTQISTMIMFISGNSAIHELVKDVKYTIYSVLSKPIEIDQLIQTVNNIVGEKCTPYSTAKPIAKLKADSLTRIIEYINQNITGLEPSSILVNLHI